MTSTETKQTTEESLRALLGSDSSDESKLPTYAWPGGYPLYYIMADSETLCPACANGENGSEATIKLLDKDGDKTDKQWLIVACGVHYEGEPITCAHCNAEIESAYGNPDAEDQEPGEGEPDDDDITTEDDKTFYQYQKVYMVASGDGSRAYNELLARMAADNFYPNVWRVSDHGNTCLLNASELASEELPETSDESESEE